jgi:hypothetical protein
MIVTVIGNDLEEDSYDLREDYPCYYYISALMKRRGKIQP